MTLKQQQLPITYDGKKQVSKDIYKGMTQAIGPTQMKSAPLLKKESNIINDKEA